jgi:hypothetical protein
MAAQGGLIERCAPGFGRLFRTSPPAAMDQAL